MIVTLALGVNHCYQTERSQLRLAWNDVLDQSKEQREQLAAAKELVDMAWDALGGAAASGVVHGYTSNPQDLERADRFIKRLATLYPWHKDAHDYLRAAWCHATGRYDEAKSRLEALLREQDTALYRSELALTLLELGRHGEALVHARRAATLEPTDPSRWSVLGHVFFASEQYSEALDAWRSALSRDAENPMLHYGIGLALGFLGRREEAEESFILAGALPPSDSRHHMIRGRSLISLGRPEEALEQAEAALAQEPSQGWHHHAKAGILLQLGRPQEALAAQQTAIRLAPDEPVFQQGLAVILDALDRPAEAQQARNRARELFGH